MQPEAHRATQPRGSSRTRLPAACLSALLLLVATAAAAEVLTLRQAVATALAEGPAARIAASDRRGADEATDAARSIFWPRAQVTSRAGYSNRLNDRLRAVDSTGLESSFGLASIGASEGWFNFFVHQVLFDLARWADVRRAEHEAAVARISEAAHRDRVAFEVLHAYVEALQTTLLLEQQEARLLHTQHLDERAAALLRTGRCLEAERAEVALYRREVEIDRVALAMQRDAALRQLALHIGRDATASDIGIQVDTASLGALAAERHDADDDAEQAPELRLLAVQVAIAEVRLEAARAGRYPTVSVGAGYSHYGAKRFDNFADELRAGIDFRMPVFDGFEARHAIAAAEQAVSSARLRHATALARKQQSLDALSDRLAIARQHARLADERIRLGDERIRLADLALDTQRGSVSLALAARREVERSTRAAVATRHQPFLLWGEHAREAGRLADALLAPDDDA